MSVRLADLATHLGGQLHGDPEVRVSRLHSLTQARAGDISFLSDPKQAHSLSTCQASVILVAPEALPLCPTNAIVVANPYVAFAKVAQLLDSTPQAAEGIHPTAHIDPTATLGQGVNIGPYAVIEAHAVIGDNVSIGAHCLIGQGATIGANTRLWGHVTLYHGVQLGAHCLIHSGAVLGADGFGFANNAGEWLKIPQTGTVHIGNRVEIGANTTIDRGALDNTVIADNVIIDNQCQIGHNVRIGYGTAIAGATGIAGSTHIGKYCIIGGGCCINGHISLCDGVTLSGMTMVISSIHTPGTYSSGVPAQPNRDWLKMAARLLKLNDLHQRIRNLEKNSR